MSLRVYRQKRDFKKTTEPAGRVAKTRSSRFVVQKHAARRLHYDLRLELDGVLKSWAVTRGPSLVPGDKRLAVHTEDHPLEYIDFEGQIPAGSYGAGRMIVWDQGTWNTEGDARRQLAKGHLTFELEGEKLAGRWHLVRLKNDRERPGKSGKENWLLIKADDEAAATAAGRDLLAEAPQSVKTGKTIEDYPPPEAPAKKPVVRRSPTNGSKAPAKPKRKPKATRTMPAGAIAGDLPEFIEPALATLCEKPPTGSRWLHEVKFDGYRLVARVDKGRVKLRTRSGLDWTAKFESLVPSLAALPVAAAMLDGEVVVETEEGASSFSDLQADLAAGRTDRMVLYLFDLMHLDGFDLRPVALVARRMLLAEIVGEGTAALRFSTHFGEDGAVVLKHACRLGLEGIVSKRTDAPYRSGRSKVWTKAKCVAGDEFIVVGYTPSTVQRRAIGALVLARRGEDGALVYAGRVGTGFSVDLAGRLWERLELLKAPASPVAGAMSAEARRTVRWVAPRVVASVEYRTLTGDGLLRHASFKGLRDDKTVEEVTSAPARPVGNVSPSVAEHLTHADRPLWPADGVTKEGLAHYLADVWPWMKPYVGERPLALVRCPGGIGEECFFQKHRFAGIGPDIRVTTDPEDGKDILSVATSEGLVALAQASVCEIHTWGARFPEIDRPDMITFDLDPAEDTGWDAVVHAAGEVRDRLATKKLASFLKTSGGKGLHVVVPLKPKAGWPAVKDFAARIAESMAADSPDRYTAVLSKKARTGRIFVDYLRNGRGATTVCAYSPRARAGAPVSMPIAWDELGAGIRPARFDIDNAGNRLARLSKDPWADFFSAARPLPR